MNPFSTTAVPFRVSRDNNTVVFENEYLRCAHDLDRGGGLYEAIVKNGANRNMLTGIQHQAIGLYDGNAYSMYWSDKTPAENVEITEKDDLTGLRMTQYLADVQGNRHPDVKLEYEIIYHPWGYAEHKLKFICAKRIEPVGQVRIGSFSVVPDFDCCVLRDGMERVRNPMGGSHARYLPMYHGRKRADSPVEQNNTLPRSAILLQRGVEAIEWSMGDDLQAWDDLVCTDPHWKQTYIGYDRNAHNYEVRFCILDCPQEGKYIEAGTHELSFRMALPFVKRNIMPLRMLTTEMFHFERDFEHRWPTDQEIADWQRLGATLMRLHNDCDRYQNGEFWKGGCYPPYSPGEMKKMDTFLEKANNAGVAIVPYFSVHEYHWNTPGFQENGPGWARRHSVNGPYLKNSGFGMQMCLKSDWVNKRKADIDIVLKNHAFKGIYFDGCHGSECESRSHANGTHWDNDAFLELLEWTHDRIGKDGELYLHMTGLPNLAAENLATLVLTEELTRPQITPEMFTPHVHFLNVVSRQITDFYTKVSDTERRKYALASFLHHAIVSSTKDVYLKFYAEYKDFFDTLTRYTRHSAPDEGKVSVDHPDAGASLYWNDQEMLLCLVNLSENEIETEWEIADFCGKGKQRGTAKLAPLSLSQVYLQA